MSMSHNDRLVTRWVTHVITVILLGAVVYASWDLVAHLCIDYLYHERHETGLVAALLTLYFFFLIIALGTYIRTFLTIKFNPGVVPLPANRATKSRRKSRESKGRPKAAKRQDGDIEAQGEWRAGQDLNPDSPGLEQFYSKDVFVCQADGRPKWCGECKNWKPDRSHHSRYLGRCVRKLDHYCPWVGGTVGETSFKYFTQFNFYCALYCAIVLVTSAYCLAIQIREGRPLDGHVVSLVALSGFFGLFTAAMAGGSVQLILQNITNVDEVQKPWVYHLAVRVPNVTAPGARFGTIVYPLQKPGLVPAVSGPGDRDGGSNSSQGEAVSARDRDAVRTFAILQTELGENPWNLGSRKNWDSVMGDNFMDWILPIRPSPCSVHKTTVSDYELGPLVEELKERYGLTGRPREARDGIAMASMQGIV